VHKPRPLAVLFFVLFCHAPAVLPAASVVAVVGGSGGAYAEAVSGLKSVVSDLDVTTLPDNPRLKGAQVIVTFGSDAAQQSYPGSIPLVAAMLSNPDFEIDHAGSVTRVGFPPEAKILAAKIKAIAPATSVLVAIDPKGAYTDYLKELKSAAAGLGYSVDVRKVGGVSGLVALLPGLKGSAQAIYLPPDAMLMNSSVVGALIGFCSGAGIGLFVPVPGLEKAGALASVSASFREIGRAAGLAAQAYLQGAKPGDWVYPSRADVRGKDSAVGGQDAQ